VTIIPIGDLESLCHAALRNAGMVEDDIKVTVAHFLENELSGKASHGIVRVIEAFHATCRHGNAKRAAETITDTGSMLVMDAHGRNGIPAIMDLLGRIMERIKDHGIVFSGVRNYVGSTGSMTVYLRQIVGCGFIAIIGCNSIALVAPPGGRERKIGTNPLGIGIPGENGDHFIADFATSAIAYGKIKVLKEKGERLPEGVVIDRDGNLSTDPEDAYNGAILPLAGYKGFSIGLMVALLAGPLIGAKAIKKDSYDSDGFFIIGIDPQKLGDSHVARHISDVLDDIRQTSGMPDAEEISIPGERSAKMLAKRRADGSVDVVDKTLVDLRLLAIRKAA